MRRWRRLSSLSGSSEETAPMLKGSSRELTMKKIRLAVWAAGLGVFVAMTTSLFISAWMPKMLQFFSERILTGPDRWAPSPGSNLRAELTKALPSQGAVLIAPELQAALRRAIQVRLAALTPAEIEPLVQATVRAVADRPGLPVQVAPTVVNRIEGAVQQAISTAQRPTAPAFANDFINKLIDRTAIWAPAILALFGFGIVLITISKEISGPQEEKGRQKLSRVIFYSSYIVVLAFMIIRNYDELKRAFLLAVGGDFASSNIDVYIYIMIFAWLLYILVGYFIITTVADGAPWGARKPDAYAVGRRFAPSWFNYVPDLIGNMVHSKIFEKLLDKLLDVISSRLNSL
jgi:hypothetical protein